MLARIGLWLLKLIFISTLLAYEQALNIPYLTIMAVIVLVQNQSPVGRQALIIMVGLFVATVYVLPLGLGILLVWLAVFGWKKAEHIVKPDQPRLLLTSLGIAVIVGGLSQVQLSGTQIIFLGFNIAISAFMMRFTAIATARGSDDHL